MSAQILALLIHGTYTSAIQCQHDVFENDCLAFFKASTALLGERTGRPP